MRPSSSAAEALTFARDDYASDPGARAIVAADFNRDGWLDVAHANIDRNSVTVLPSRTGASFVRAREVGVGAGPFDLATGDFNRDAIPDLAVVNADGSSISILLGRGDGSFTRSDIGATGQNPRGLTVADVNNDGRLDLVYTGFGTGTLHVLLGNGAGGFTAGVTVALGAAAPQGVAAGDFNHDRRLDLAVACDSAGGLLILFATSDGSFSVRRIAGHANVNVLAVGDLNGDGWADVVAASTRGSDVATYLGGAAGPTFSRSDIVGASPRDVALADVDSDGRLDVITANRASSTVSVLAGDRAHPGGLLPHHELAAAAGSRAVAIGDFDGDGRLDIATGNEYTKGATVLSNVTAFKRAAFSFRALSLPSGRPLASEEVLGTRFSPTTRIAAADFNRDGKIDFAVPGASADVVVVLLRDAAALLLPGPAPLTSVLVDDFNADGNSDVLSYSADSSATSPATRFLTSLGDGRGHFTPSPITREPEALEWCASGDLNRDGRPDLVCANVVLLGVGNGAFRSGVAYADPTDVFSIRTIPQIADFNRDGKLDVILNGAGVFLGDGTGNLTPADLLSADIGAVGPVVAVGDLDHDAWPDLVVDEGQGSAALVFGGADGFHRVEWIPILEGSSSIAVADINVDGRMDVVQNGSLDAESLNRLVVLRGGSDRTFDGSTFSQSPGPVIVADLTGDGLPDAATYDASGIRILVNERNETNHPPVVSTYSLSSTTGCVILEPRASDSDQHSLQIEWIDPPGTTLRSLFGFPATREVCVDAPGTYIFLRTVTDGIATVTGMVTVTFDFNVKEIVLYAGAETVTMTGNWTRVADPTAAGGVRAHNRNLGAPKVLQPSANPVDAITIPFIADENLAYKLWIRLKADGDHWSNDSVWVQFSGFGAGTNFGLPVSLEECIDCGVSRWGWEDDGFGAVNKNGPLLHFGPGHQFIVIQTREDGVSIDQVVLSAEKYLTTRPGAAKNDRTILPP